jgi:disulfide bond formation protein DsbB
MRNPWWPTAMAAWLSVLTALVGVAGSLYLSLGLGLKACPLCFYQRSFVIAGCAVLVLSQWLELDRPARACVLALPLVWAGLGIAGFHEYLVLVKSLECPQGLFGVGTAPAQSLALFVVLASACTVGAWTGRRESARQGAGLVVAAVMGGLLIACACLLSSPPLPAVPTEPYDPVKQPLEVCRPPYRGSA